MWAKSDQKTFNLRKTHLHERRNSLSNHRHKLYLSTLRRNERRTHNNLQSIQTSNDNFRKIHLKCFSMSKDSAESLIDCRLRNLRKYHLRQKSSISFRLLNNILQKTENKTAHVHSLSFADRRSIRKNKSNRWNCLAILHHEKFKKRLSQRSFINTSQLEQLI